MSTDCSIGEIRSLVFKAYRGIGRPWGLAEEAGFAAGWLARRGLPAAEIFLGVAQRFDGTSYAQCAPMDMDSAWTAPGGALCPVIAGALLSDAPDRSARPGGLILHQVAAPLITLAFAESAARKTGSALSVEWGPNRAVCAPAGHRFEFDPASPWIDCADALSIAVTDHDGAAAGPNHTRLACRDADILGLEHFAHRTYVPESEQSRLGGAGAGLTDND